MTTRHLVLLLLSIHCVPSPAFAQNDAQRMAEVLCAGEPECLALARHRLTADGLRRMFAADRELFTVMKDLDVHRRMDELAKSIDPQGRMGKVTRSAHVYEQMPEVAQVLRRHQISGREYAFTHAVAMVTAMAEDSFAFETQRGGGKDIPPALMTPAMKFWRSMDPALRAEADAWKKMRGYDKGLNR